MDNITQAAYRSFQINMQSKSSVLTPEYRNCSIPPASLSGCFGTKFSVDTLLLILFYTTNDTEFRYSWTCGDIASYCDKEAAYTHSYNSIHDFNAFGQFLATSNKYLKSLTLEKGVFAPIGFLSNINLFLTVLSLLKEGDVFWFLSLISLAQIGQALNRMGGTSYFIGLIPSSSFGRIFFENVLTSEECFNAAKAFSITAAFFMSLYRFLAVGAPIWFSKMNFKKYFIGTCVFSTFVGCLPMIGIYHIYGSDIGAWGVVKNRSVVVAREYISQFMAFYEITISITAILLSAMTMRALRARQKRISTMMSSAAVLEEHKQMVAMCQIQVIETMGLIVDVCILFTYLLYLATTRVVRCQVKHCLDQASVDSQRLFYYAPLTAYEVFSLLRGFCHCELFFLYLIFSQKFRAGYKKLYPSIWRKIKSIYFKLKAKCCCKSNAVTSTRIAMTEIRVVSPISQPITTEEATDRAVLAKAENPM